MSTTQVRETATDTRQRQGVLIAPQERLAREQLQMIDAMARDLLEDPGVLCHNTAAVGLFREVGARVDQADGCARVRIPSCVVDRAIGTAPSRIVLGARKPENRLVLDAREPRVRFGTGAETNVWLDVQYDGETPRFTRGPGSIERLRQMGLGDLSVADLNHDGVLNVDDMSAFLAGQTPARKNIRNTTGSSLR